MLECVVHALPHISFAILLCEHVGAYFTHSRTSTCCFDCLVLSSFFQVDGQECLWTLSSYLCFSRIKLYSCYITKFDQVRFEPLCVRSTRSPWFVIDLNFQNLFVILGRTKMEESVRPRITKKFWKFKSMMNRRLRVLLTQSGSNLTWSNFVM